MKGVYSYVDHNLVLLRHFLFIQSLSKRYKDDIIIILSAPFIKQRMGNTLSPFSSCVALQNTLFLFIELSVK